jgi:hypothetical protein
MAKKIGFHRVRVDTYNGIGIKDLLTSERLTKQLGNGWAYFVWPVEVEDAVAGLIMVSKHQGTIRRFVRDDDEIELQVQQMAANEKFGEFGLFAINPDTGGGILTRYSQDGVRPGLEWVLDDEHRRQFATKYPGKVPRKVPVQTSLLPQSGPRRAVSVSWALSHQDYQEALRSAARLRAFTVMGKYSVPEVTLFERLFATNTVRRVAYRIELDPKASPERLIAEIEQLPPAERDEIKAELQLAQGGVVSFDLDKPRLPLKTADLVKMIGSTVRPKDVASTAAMSTLLEVYRNDSSWHSCPSSTT